MPSTYSGIAGNTARAAPITISSTSSVGGGGAITTVTTATPHGMSTGDRCWVYGCNGQSGSGNPWANGIWAITKIDATHFTLQGSYGNGNSTAETTAFVLPLNGPALTIPSDGDSRSAASVNVPIEAVADRTSYLMQRSGALPGTSWPGMFPSFQAAYQTAAPILTMPFFVAASPGATIGTLATTTTPAPVGLGNALTVSAASNAPPIVITTTASHGLVSGQLVTVAGVGGNTAANGTWRVKVTGGTTFSLAGSAGNGAYTSGGTVQPLMAWAIDNVAKGDIVDLDFMSTMSPNASQPTQLLYLAASLDGYQATPAALNPLTQDIYSQPLQASPIYNRFTLHSRVICDGPYNVNLTFPANIVGGTLTVALYGASVSGTGNITIYHGYSLRHTIWRPE